MDLTYKRDYNEYLNKNKSPNVGEKNYLNNYLINKTQRKNKSSNYNLLNDTYINNTLQGNKEKPIDPNYFNLFSDDKESNDKIVVNTIEDKLNKKPSNRFLALENLIKSNVIHNNKKVQRIDFNIFTQNKPKSSKYNLNSSLDKNKDKKDDKNNEVNEKNNYEINFNSKKNENELILNTIQRIDTITASKDGDKSNYTFKKGDGLFTSHTEFIQSSESKEINTPQVSVIKIEQNEKILDKLYNGGDYYSNFQISDIPFEKTALNHTNYISHKNMNFDEISVVASSKSNSFSALETIKKAMEQKKEYINSDTSVFNNDKIGANIGNLGEELHISLIQKNEVNININEDISFDNIGFVQQSNSVSNFTKNSFSKPNILSKVVSKDLLDGRIKMVNNYNDDISRKIRELKIKLGKFPKEKIKLEKFLSLNSNIFEKLTSFLDNNENYLLYYIDNTLKNKFKEVISSKAVEISKLFSLKYKNYFQLSKSVICIENKVNHKNKNEISKIII